MEPETPKDDMQDLAVIVHSTLSDASEVHNVITGPQAIVLLRRLALLVAEAAALIDEHLKHSTICKLSIVLQYESAYTPGLITHPPFTPLTSIYVKCRLYWHTLAILVAKQRVSTSGRLLHTNYQTV